MPATLSHHLMSIFIGKMAVTADKFKPDSDRGSDRGRRSRYDDDDRGSLSVVDFGQSSSSLMSSFGGGGSGGYSGGDGGAIEGRLSSLENSVASLQRALNDQDRKLDTVIDLQRQMLRLMQGGEAGVGGGGAEDVSCPPSGRRRR